MLMHLAGHRKKQGHAAALLFIGHAGNVTLFVSRPIGQRERAPGGGRAGG